SKPINVAAVMTLSDRGEFRLDDRVRRFLPAFDGDGRGDVTIRHLLTHTSGLPDQLADNDELRKRHAPLSEFARQAMHTPLGFAPGTRYQYSSMGILLATQIGERLGGAGLLPPARPTPVSPPGLKHSAPRAGRHH